VAGEQLTVAEMAEQMGRAIGRPVKYNPVSPDVYRGFGFPGADEVGNMHQFYHDFNDDVCRIRDVGFSRSMNPALQTFDQWLKENARKIPLG
jgi:hypothetical protein